MQQNAIKEEMVKQHGADTLGTPPPPPPPIEQSENDKHSDFGFNTEKGVCNRNEASSPPAPSSSYQPIKPLSEVRVENQRNAADSTSTMSSSLPAEYTLSNLDECRKNLKFLKSRRRSKLKRQQSS